MTFFKKKNTREDHAGFFSSFFFAFRLLVSIDKLLSFFQFLTILILAFIPTGILWTLKKILDLLQNHQKNSWEDVLPFIGLFSLLWIVQGILNQAETYFNFVFHEKITDKLIVELLKKTSTAPMLYVDNPDFQDSLHLAQQQARYKLPGLFNNVKSFLVNMISFTVLLIYFFYLLKDFAWLITLIAIPMLILKWFLANSKYQLEKSLVPMERKANYFAHVLTSPEHAKEIRAFRIQDYFSDRFTGIRQLMYSRKNRLQNKIIWIGLVAEILELGVLIYVFYDLFKLSFSQSISMGVLVVYVQGIQRLQTSLKSLLESLLQLFQQRVFVKNFQQFVLLNWDEDTDKTLMPVDWDNIRSGLKVSSLDFSYPGGPKVLKNISVTCKPGEFIAIVGLNGSGKSTLMKLLAGLYPPDSGQVLLEGVPLSSLPPEEWASQTEFVFQDFEHYHLTFKENVGLGLHSMDEQRLEDAAKKGQSREFLQKLPKKWDTQLGKWFPGGVELSGGEWQRVALTRAFYNSPKFWVLDEPSSFLDVEAEASLFKEIKAISPDRMTVLISHRLYNLKYADRIYVLKDGEMVQDGPFEQLKNIPGPFRELYKMQEI